MKKFNGLLVVIVGLIVLGGCSSKQNTVTLAQAQNEYLKHVDVDYSFSWTKKMET